MTWTVYIIEADDGRLYTGVTTDMERRWREHLDGRGGAKFFRGRKPQALRYTEPALDRSAAQRREHRIKGMSRQAKLRLIGEEVR